MPTIDPFAKAWRFKAPGCPFFPADHNLTITIPDVQKPECNVAWREGSGKTWNITAIPLAEDGGLAHDSIDVWSINEHHQRKVRLWLEDNNQTLKGCLEEIPPPPPGRYGNGPVGTFTAEAGSGEEAATRLEEHIAV